MNIKTKRDMAVSKMMPILIESNHTFQMYDKLNTSDLIRTISKRQTGEELQFKLDWIRKLKKEV